MKCNEEIFELLNCHCKISITIKHENKNIIQRKVWIENSHWKIWLKINAQSQVTVNQTYYVPMEWKIKLEIFIV